MENKIRLAVVGIGHLGSRHLKVYSELRDRVDIMAICDIQPERTQRMARHYGVPFVRDYTELAGRVDAVNICVPTSAHFELARFFLQQGVHTFIEKPITTTLEQADDLIALARKNQLCLQVGHVERFNSAFQAIRHFTHEPRFIECHRLNTFPNRSLDIGVVMDLMIHDIDIILGLNPGRLVDCRAVGVNVLTDQEDIASARLEFENGCVSNLTASRVSDEVMRKIRIFLDDTYISIDTVKQDAKIYKRAPSGILKHALPIEKEEPLKKELVSFLDAIEGKHPVVVTGEDGRKALALALEITQKIRRHPYAASSHSLAP